jgi:hypothetical protein
MSTPVTLWRYPGPIDALVREPKVRVLPRRLYQISFSTEDQNFTLQFQNVAAFKCTHLPLVTAAMIGASYGQVVELGETPWLAESRKIVERHPIFKGLTLRHLQICFDDGPCYEFLCEGFAKVNSDTSP